MAYVPNADDATQPLDSEYAASAAAEFRALKTKVNLLFTSASVIANQNAIGTPHGFFAINNGLPSGGTAEILFGLYGKANRTAGTGPTLGGLFESEIGDSIGTLHVDGVRGILAEVKTGIADSQARTLIGGEFRIVQRDHQGQQDVDVNLTGVAGIALMFFDRLEGETAVEGGLGLNKYNEHACAIFVHSQSPSTVGERCGWSCGIRFTDYALAASAELAHPVAFDLTGLGKWAEEPSFSSRPVPFHFSNLGLLSGAPAVPGGAIPIPDHANYWVQCLIDGNPNFGIPLYQISFS